MKITSESLINDALRLRKSQDEIKGTGKSSKSTDKAKSRIKDTLGQINVNLKTHQQTVARLQLENIGLDRIEQSIDQLLKQNPGDYDQLRQSKNEMQTVIDATRFQNEPLIPQTIREMITNGLKSADDADKLKQSVTLRREAISGKLQMEFAQISKIQVSFENVLSQQLPGSDNIDQTIRDIKEQMTIQDRIQSNVDPATVMGLIN